MESRLKLAIMVLMSLFILAIGYLSVTKLTMKKTTPKEITTVRDTPALPKNISEVNLESYRGSHPVLLFFWTTWCPYCRQELKSLNENYPELLKDGVIVIPVDIGERSGTVENFLKRQNLTFPVYMDPDGSFSKAYEIIGIPAFILFDKKGTMIFKNYYFPRQYKELIS